MMACEIVKILPQCGLWRQIDDNPEDEVWVDDDGEELAMCRYCGDWDPEERYIEMMVDGKIEMCCECCFWEWIEDGHAEEAVFVLEHRIGGGAADVPWDELLQSLKNAEKWRLYLDGEISKIKRIKRKYEGVA